jgi:hypothetical protein
VVRRRRIIGALAVVGILATGCAIPTQSRPNVISPSHVPFHLLEPRLPTTTTTQPLPSSLVPVKIYLLGASQHLEAFQRLILSPAPLTSVLSSLVVGPTNSETVGGTSTAIPTSVRVLSVITESDIVIVNFNAAFAGITGAATEVAVSQVVATVAAQNGLGTGVIFEIGGVRTGVPIASGVEVLGPVYAAQYFPVPTTPTTVPATAS